MKKIIFAIAVFAAGIMPAHAEDDCILNLEALQPVMRADLQDHAVDLNREERTLTETATLDDGTKVTYTVGGCAHFAFSYTFENMPGGMPSSGDPIALLLELFATLPFRDNFDADILVNALKEKQDSGNAAFDETGKTDLPCGDAVCVLTLKHAAVTVSYDFAL